VEFEETGFGFRAKLVILRSGSAWDALRKQHFGSSWIAFRKGKHGVKLGALAYSR